MSTYRSFVGLDVHARSVSGCALDEATGEVLRHRFGGDVGDVIAWVRGLPGPIRVAYEAGPTGFGLARMLNLIGIECVVVAPSKLMRPSGDKVKTDARDALYLARLLRVGEVTIVEVPSEAQECVRDLVRSREDCRHDLGAAQHRLSKLLLRRGIVYSDGTAWTGKHDAWLRRQRVGDPSFLSAFDAYYETVVQTAARRARLDKDIEAIAANSDYTPIVNRLGCLVGMAPLTALSLAAEIPDWHRFTGKTIGSFIGLVPSESSSGSTRRLGSITKTGNSHLRRLLIEAAWLHQKPYNPGPRSVLQARWAKAPQAAVLRGQAGNKRLNQQWKKFILRRKHGPTANVAIARELSGWCWSLAVMES
ncbi:IS110 family transposase [Cryobacterium frigoriphilum]|uniref:IS110 family transposase n=1 Tax=Cryobacterium frigoriphilum TaxID=1259150 RepID=A0A4R9AAP9_9MICO|nr:IS110 family transposase [Cryobacterium frigoriphilum]TFD55402.1 IS110 family transposase [Cryobacterium frigoriphilum]